MDQENNQERFNLIRRIEQTNGNWNSTIELISGNKKIIDIAQLLVHKCYLASESITKEKVDVLNKLFDEIQNFFT